MNLLSLTGRTAFVSGSSFGIGFQVVKGLAQMGATVFLNGRNAERLDKAIKKIKESDPKAQVKGIAADLSNKEGCAKVCKELPELDILVNNLGIFGPKEFQEVTDEEWMEYFETNVMSSIRLSRHYMPQMLEKKWGRIVFVSSETAISVHKSVIHYSMTKTCQLSLACGLSHLTKGTGVTVNSVLPGPTNSEGLATYMRNLAELQGIKPEEIEKEFIKTEMPWYTHEKFLSVEEVANSVLYLCSTASSATNGACLRCDGGALQQMIP